MTEARTACWQQKQAQTTRLLARGTVADGRAGLVAGLQRRREGSLLGQAECLAARVME